MKRFDKRYIYASLLTDLFSSIVIPLIFFEELFVSEDPASENIRFAIPLFIAVSAVFYLCFITYRILYYRASGYQMTENEIVCKRGVIFKKRSLLEYKRVHAINKRQRLIHRIFGIAVLTVDSGSANTSHQAEITIVEREKTVDALIKELNSLKESGVKTGETDIENKEVLLSDKDSLYTFTSGKKMLYTLIHIISTAFFTAVFCMLTVLVLSACKLLLQLDFLGTWGQYLLYAVQITVGATLLFSAFSFIGYLLHSFIGYYNFTITKQDGNIQISFGLLEKHTNTFSYDRIKAVKISQGIVQRMLGFATIKLEVIGYTVSNEENSQAIGVLVPFCKYEEISEILNRILPDFVPDEKQTKSVSYFPFISWFALILGTITGLVLLQTVVSLMIFKVSSAIILPVAIGIVGIGAFILAIKALDSLLAYQNNGLTICDGKITAYYGGFTKNITVFRSNNLIAAENVTTPLRKKAGITSLVMHLKTNSTSNEIKVHIQEDRLTEEIEQMLRL